MQNELTIWQKQEELRKWHEEEYKREYPTSEFYTGHTLLGKGETWDTLSPQEQEHKETIAHKLNCMLMSIGTNVGPFRDKQD